MKRHILKINKLNKLYDIWDKNPCDQTLGNLLEAVRLRTSKRFARLVESVSGNHGPLHSSYEDIASETVIRVWRALPGYPGSDPIKIYEHQERFASYVRTVAEGIKKDLDKLADNRYVSHFDPIPMEYIQAGLEVGYESPEPPDFWNETDDDNED